MQLKSTLKIGALFCLLIQLAACSVFTPKSPAKVYQLAPAKVAESKTTPITLALRIDQPQAPAQLRNEQITRVTHAHKVEAFQGARWVAPVPKMLRDYLLDAFSRQGRIAHLSHDGDKLKADYALVGTLSAFQTEFPKKGKPVAAIRIHLQLIDVKREMIVAGRHFEYSEPPKLASGAQEPSAEAVVAALSQDSAKLADDVSVWVVKSLLTAQGISKKQAEVPVDGTAKPALRDPTNPPAVTF